MRPRCGRCRPDESGLVENDEAEIGLRPGDGLARRRGDLRLEPRELLQHHVGAEDEIARVPHIALADEGFCPLLVRLLDEAFDATHPADRLR